MKSRYRLTLAAALPLLIAAVAPADAATRLYCVCQGKQSARLHHKFACEYHFKKPFTRAATSSAKPVGGGCTRQEWAQFRTHLCVADRCTYAYVKASEATVPLGAP